MWDNNYSFTWYCCNWRISFSYSQFPFLYTGSLSTLSVTPVDKIDPNFLEIVFTPEVKVSQSSEDEKKTKNKEKNLL